MDSAPYNNHCNHHFNAWIPPISTDSYIEHLTDLTPDWDDCRVTWQNTLHWEQEEPSDLSPGEHPIAFFTPVVKTESDLEAPNEAIFHQAIPSPPLSVETCIIERPIYVPQPAVMTPPSEETVHVSTGSKYSKSRKRIPHTLVEKRYREHLNATISTLRRCVPFLASNDDDDANARSSTQAPTKAAIIAGAIQYIQQLEQENAQLRHHLSQRRRH